MTIYVNSYTQLDVIDVHKAVLLSNAIIAKKITKNDIYEFDPKHKNLKVNIPYIIARPLQNTPDRQDLQNTLTINPFEQEIVLRMDYEARDNARVMANNIIGVIDNSRATYRASGYDNVQIRLTSATPILIEQKDIIEIVFYFTGDYVVSV